MSCEIAIDVSHVSKQFDLANGPVGTLRSIMLQRMRLGWLDGKLSASGRKFDALRDVSFSVRRGETLGIIGRNGSGKSTLLQIICGTLSPSSGSVRTSGTIAPLLELGAGFDPNFTGRENVYLNAALLGVSREQTAARFAEIERFADIGPFIDRPVRTYSSGMFVRLAFATAIHTDPDILVIDEALSVGDEAFQRKCFSRIEDIKASGGTILFVSHGAQAVIELCDRAVMLDRGEKILEGDPKRVVSEYQKFLSLDDQGADRLRSSLMQGAAEPETAHPEDGQKDSRSHESDQLKAYFDSTLRSESVVEYFSKGVRIEDPKITTLAGEPVNCLIRGERYIYRYDVVFETHQNDIAFGMYVKTPTGVGLGGASTEAAKTMRLPHAAAGSRHTVRFTFTCALTPGVYFTNSGVYGQTEEGRDFLHRLMDAIAFRVQPEVEALAYGPLDLSVEYDLD